MKPFKAILHNEELIKTLYFVCVTANPSSFSGKWKTFDKEVVKKLGIKIEFVDLKKDKIKPHSESNTLKVGYVTKQCRHIWEVSHHIRNAFCHLNIRQNGGDISLQDIGKSETADKNIMTMYGNLSSTKFTQLINSLASFKKK